MFNWKKLFMTKEEREKYLAMELQAKAEANKEDSTKLEKKLTFGDDAWHSGMYFNSGKQYKYEELVEGNKYIYVVMCPSASGYGGMSSYKSVILLKKWKTKFLWFKPNHVKVKSTWNGREDESTLAWHGGTHMFEWKDIDKDRKK